MAYEPDTEPIIIRTAANVVAPVNDIPVAEWADVKSRLLAIEGLGLVDLSDVDLTGLGDKLVLVYDAASETWKPDSVAGAIERVDNNQGFSADNVKRLSFRWGLTASLTPGGDVQVHPLFGTASQTVAEGSHTHQIRTDTQLTFSASGSFSSGTRTLVSGNVTGLDPARTYIIKGKLTVDLRGDGSGAGYTRPRVTINGNSVDRPERPRSVAGVTPEYSTTHPGVSVTGVSSVAVSASLAYSEGDPTWVGGGALTISVESNR